MDDASPSEKESESRRERRVKSEMRPAESTDGIGVPSSAARSRIPKHRFFRRNSPISSHQHAVDSPCALLLLRNAAAVPPVTLWPESRRSRTLEFLGGKQNSLALRIFPLWEFNGGKRNSRTRGPSHQVISSRIASTNCPTSQASMRKCIKSQPVAPASSVR